MKRPLLIIAICLLLGAVVNVAVAWGCAAWADVGTDYTEGISEDGTASLLRWSSNIGTLIYFERNRTATLNRTMRGSRRMDELSPYWLHLDVPSAAYQSGRISGENSFTDARGWPALTMWSEYEWPMSWSEYEWPASGIVVNGGLPLSSRHSVGQLYFYPPPPRALPLRPIWPGFTINTILYAAILWLVIPGPFALRRIIRRKRGLCVSCGYDIRHADHDACPECGAVA